MAATPSSFSYAQAAKGQSMSRSESQEASTTGVRQGSIPSSEQKNENTEKIQKVEAVAKSEEDSKPASIMSSTEEPSMTNGIPASQNSISKVAHLPSTDNHTRDVSPSVESNAATKVSNEDRASTTLAESESTWEKVSQDSRGRIGSTSPKSDADDSKISVLEHSKPQMKEAPVPMVNIWQKRMEDAKTGVKATSPAAAKSEQSSNHINGDINKDSIVPKGKSLPTPAEGISHKRSQKPMQNGSAERAAVPSPSDTSLWPTPDLAKVEDKKKEGESVEEKSVNKAHTKEKWEKIDFVPTAVFSTPLPSRGGARGGRIGGRGGREGTTRGGSMSAIGSGPNDRSVNASNAEPAPAVVQSGDRSKARDSSLARGGAVPKSKRSSSAGGANSKDASQSAETFHDKRESVSSRTYNNQRTVENRRTSSSTQTEAANTGAVAQLNGTEGQRRNVTSFETNGEPRYPRGERVFQQRSRDSAPEQAGYLPSRDRGESRPERGSRGSWRGKNAGPGHATFGPSGSYQHPSGYSKPGPYSDSRGVTHVNGFSVSAGPRHSRTNSRSHSIQNSQSYSNRFGMQNMGPNGLPGIQTDMANNFSYVQPPAIMSAVPFQPYMEQVQLPAMVQMQLEYYFSVDNLCKDMYLRSHMDSQGWVFLHLLQKFNRIQTLTTDVNLLKWILSRSSVIEHRTGPDGLDRLRKAEDWQQWVLPIGDRVPTAQTEGPASLLSPRIENFPVVFNSGFEVGQSIAQSQPVTPVHPFMMNGGRSNPFLSEVNGHTGQAPTALSANVPDFKPTHFTDVQNTSMPEDKFPDSDLASLRVSVGSNTDDSASSKNDAPKQQINGTTNHTEGESKEPKVNGVVSDEHKVNGVADSQENVKDLSNGVESHKERPTDSANITWTDSASESESSIAYAVFRSQALQERNTVPIGQSSSSMSNLYKFWSVFLLKNFNNSVYQDFHNTALEDANTRQSLDGLTFLANFYSKSFNSEANVPDRLVKDFVELATVEHTNQHPPNGRPAFTQLRKVWKDGATSQTDRITLSKKLSEPMKKALEREESVQSP